PYKPRFDLVGRESASFQYQRPMKRCMFFCFRLWRTCNETRQQLVKRFLTESESEGLA
ncbi:hypothetical protein C7974DRAFT_317536, partial [Boeremia exigua]|uniref:uncharacterized protein n=1 Tax=Boeremia exigua TaxID=749465 RepID=UPI001E8D2ABF